MKGNNLVYNYLETIPYGSFELKEELEYRAEKAIEEGDLSKLYGEVVLFKPDDVSCEECSAEHVRNFIEAIGFDDFVARIIEDNWLRERLAGRFAAIAIENAVRSLIKKAIESGNIEKVTVDDFSVNYYDRGRETVIISKKMMEMKLKEAGLWDYINYQIWLRNNCSR